LTYLLCTGIVVIVVVVAAVFACCKVHPVTGAPISGPFYEPGSTWDSTFGKLASPMEECRAECCGVYLCLEPSVLRVFGHAIEGAWGPFRGEGGLEGGWRVRALFHSGGVGRVWKAVHRRKQRLCSSALMVDGFLACLLTCKFCTVHDGTALPQNLPGGAAARGELHDVAYVNWLLMARAGLVGLEFYTPETQSWRQVCAPQQRCFTHARSSSTDCIFGKLMVIGCCMLLLLLVAVCCMLLLLLLIVVACCARDLFQAHMMARFVILRVLLEASDDAEAAGSKRLLTLVPTTGADSAADVEVRAPPHDRTATSCSSS